MFGSNVNTHLSESLLFVIDMTENISLNPKEAAERISSGKAKGPIHVDGILDLSKLPSLKKLPRGLSCFELDASNTSIVELPEDLNVESRLVLRNCKKLKELPEGLTVGTLDLEGCSALEALPEKLDVWFLNLRGCRRLETLPKSAKIQCGSLSLAGCERLRGLPSYLKKLSTLDISDCPNIRTLPPKLEVGLWIDIAGSGVTKLAGPNESVGIRWRGVAIHHRIAFAPESISAKEVLAEKNAEIRRVMIERMGTEKFMAQANPKVIDRDTDTGGDRELLRLPLQNDEDFVCLSCNCPSTQRHYLLRVPPTMKTCHQAAAWMAGFDDPSKYKPIIET